jgi:hypothetical protein
MFSEHSRAAEASKRGLARFIFAEGAPNRSPLVKSLEMTLLAGGAAMSLFAGAAAARFGLTPLDDAFARQQAKANVIALAQPTSAADGGQIQEAVYSDYRPTAAYSGAEVAPEARPESEQRIATETTDPEPGGAPPDDVQVARDAGDSAGHQYSTNPDRAPVWEPVVAVADHREGQGADVRETAEAATSTPSQSEPMAPDQARP